MKHSFFMFVVSAILVGSSGLSLGTETQSPETKSNPSFPWFQSLKPEEKALFTAIAEEQFCPCGQPRSFQDTLLSPEACADAVQLGHLLAKEVKGVPSKRRVVKALLKRMATISARVQIDTKGDIPRLGDAGSPIAVVVFSDFQCPYCSKVGESLKAAAKAEDVMLIYKYYPLSFHTQAKGAAQAACAAHLQGKFWEMHDALFDAQRDLESGDFTPMAKRAGLDMNRFEKDRNGEQCRKAVEADITEGDRIQLQGTPSVYVNGLVVEQIETMESAIDEARQFERK